MDNENNSSRENPKYRLLFINEISVMQNNNIELNTEVEYLLSNWDFNYQNFCRNLTWLSYSKKVYIYIGKN